MKEGDVGNDEGGGRGRVRWGYHERDDLSVGNIQSTHRAATVVLPENTVADCLSRKVNKIRSMIGARNLRGYTPGSPSLVNMRPCIFYRPLPSCLGGYCSASRSAPIFVIFYNTHMSSLFCIVLTYSVKWLFLSRLLLFIRESYLDSILRNTTDTERAPLQVLVI